MRILISGSTGFIGRALTERLVAEGHHIHRLHRGEAREGEAQLLIGERRIDASKLPGGSLEGLDAVINLAGEPITPFRWTPAKRERIRGSRIASTDILARSLARLEGPPSVLVSASAVGYYGDRSEEILDETSSAGEGFLAELCLAWEAVTSPARERGIRVALARTGIVLGPGGGSLAAQLPLFRVGLGGRLGNGRQWTSFISLEDEVGALLHLLGDENLSGSFNLTAPEPVRNAELTKALGRALSRPTVLAVPRLALRLAMGHLVADEVVLASQRALPRRLLTSGFTFARPGIDEALAAAVAREPRRSRLTVGR